MHRLLSWEQHHHYFSWLLTFLVHVLNYRSTFNCERSCWVIPYPFLSKLNSIIKVCFQQKLSKQGHNVLNYYSLSILWNCTYILPTWKSMFLRKWEAFDVLTGAKYLLLPCVLHCMVVNKSLCRSRGENWSQKLPNISAACKCVHECWGSAVKRIMSSTSGQFVLLSAEVSWEHDKLVAQLDQDWLWPWFYTRFLSALIFVVSDFKIEPP